MTTRQAGELLGVALRTVQLWVESGVLPAWRTAGGHRRIARTAVEKLVAERSRKLHAPSHAEAVDAANAVRILVVEDDANLLHLIALVMKKWSFLVELTTAGNGFEGLLRIGQVRPHLVVTDLNMPFMDGFEMLRAIKKPGVGCEDMELVAISAFSADEIAAKGGLPAGVRYFKKPVDYGKLREIAEQIFHRVARPAAIAA